jgi:hypothetical protein
MAVKACIVSFKEDTIIHLDGIRGGRYVWKPGTVNQVFIHVVIVQKTATIVQVLTGTAASVDESEQWAAISGHVARVIKLLSLSPEHLHHTQLYKACTESAPHLRFECDVEPNLKSPLTVTTGLDEVVNRVPLSHDCAVARHNSVDPSDLIVA